MNETAIAHWHSIAREWRYFGSPLRPCDEDTRFMSKIIAKQFEGKRDLKDLLCGVTPEIACMPWPSGALLTAVERAGDMIQEVWPGDMPGIRKVQQGDWLEIETDEAAFDVVEFDIFGQIGVSFGFHGQPACDAFELNTDAALRPRSPEMMGARITDGPGPFSVSRPWHSP